MNKRLKWIMRGLLFIFLTIITVSYTRDWLDWRHRQEVYQKVVRQLVTINQFKPQQLYHFLVENQIDTGEIKLSIGFFFEKMTRQVTGERIKVVLPPIKVRNLQAVNMLLAHMLIIEKAKAIADHFAIGPEPELVKELYQLIFQYYQDNWYDEDCKAIRSLLRNGEPGAEPKIFFPQGGQIMATFFI